MRFYRKNWKRVFRVRTLMCILIVPILIMLDTDDNVINLLFYSGERSYEGLDIVYYIYGMLQWGLYHGIILIIATIPFACEFSVEWKEKMSLHIIQKVGVERYSAMHIIISGCTGGIVTMAGFLLYVGLMHLKLPIYLNNGLNAEFFTEIAYGEYLTESPMGYILMIAFCWFFTGVVVGAVAVASSGICINRYIIMIVPYVIWNIYIEAAKALGIPDQLRIDWLLMGKLQLGKGIFSIWIVALLTAFIVFFCWIFFYKKLKERMKNGCA